MVITKLCCSACPHGTNYRYNDPVSGVSLCYWVVWGYGYDDAEATCFAQDGVMAYIPNADALAVVDDLRENLIG